MKTGRKSQEVKEITDRQFTIVDLVKINTEVKAPTLRQYVKRNVDAGRFVLVGSVKTGKRGKPSNLYTISPSVS